MTRDTIESLAQQFVRSVLAALEGESKRATRPQPTTYSSRELPPDVTNKDYFHKLVKQCPGASCQGRFWTVDAEAWRVYRAKSCKRTGRRPRDVQPGVSNVPADLDAYADQILKNAGFRATR